LNLESNALKFTDRGTVTIKVSNDDEYIFVSVKDTGSGISQLNQQKLFKLFSFIENTSAPNTNGIGLGLVIAQQIVLQYEGQIWVDSELGRGSTFTFKLKIIHNEEQ